MASNERAALRLSPEDYAKIGQGHEWQADLIDLATLRSYTVCGCPCTVPGCFCDAVIVKEIELKDTPAPVHDNSNIAEFLNEYWLATRPHPLTAARVWMDRATLTVIEPHDALYTASLQLVFLEAFTCGQGDGTRAIGWLCEMADVHGITLMVNPHVNLKAFFRKHGFQKIGPRSELYRAPAGRL